MGIDLYKRLDWKKLSEIHLEGDEIVSEGVTVAVMEYDPATATATATATPAAGVAKDQSEL